MRVCLSERTIKPNNGFITKHGAIIESRVNEMECTMNSLGNIAKHGAIFNYHYYMLLHLVNIWSCCLPCCSVEDRIWGVSYLETPVSGAFEWFVWIPVTLELFPQCIFQLFSEQVYSSITRRNYIIFFKNCKKIVIKQGTQQILLRPNNQQKIKQFPNKMYNFVCPL